MSRNRQLNAIIENDHFEYWAFVYSVLQSSRGPDWWAAQHHPLKNYLAASVVDRLRPQYEDPENKRFQNAVLASYGNSTSAPVWAGFAYLEGLGRRICARYVTESGEVRRAFCVKGNQYRSPRGHAQARGKAKGRKQISSLRDLLELTRRQVGKGCRKQLRRVFGYYSTDEIYSWRNSVLHGAEDRSTTVIVLYSVISMLLLDMVERSRSGNGT
jgi:hypothetical protein